MLSRRRFVAAAAGAGIAAHPLILAQRAFAQTIARPARMIVGFSAGGGVDAVARLLVEHIRGYAQSLIVENRTGAGGRLALETLKAAEPDGSAMGLMPADQLSLYPHIFRRLNYRPLEDYAPVGVVCSFQSDASWIPLGRAGSDVAGLTQPTSPRKTPLAAGSCS